MATERLLRQYAEQMRACRIVAVYVAIIASVNLAACAAPIECREPLTKAQCDDAVRQANEFLVSHADGMPTPSGERPRLTLVWKACTDPPHTGCWEDFEGTAFVRVVDGAGNSLGRVIVCIDEARCEGEGPTFGFP
jgi:hypothetical protein